MRLRPLRVCHLWSSSTIERPGRFSKAENIINQAQANPPSSHPYPFSPSPIFALPNPRLCTQPSPLSLSLSLSLSLTLAPHSSAPHLILFGRVKLLCLPGTLQHRLQPTFPGSPTGTIARQTSTSHLPSSIRHGAARLDGAEDELLPCCRDRRYDW